MEIETKSIWHGRTGNDKCYFHPRATSIKDKALIMTLQEITGSDYFHQVQYSVSEDQGCSWTEPQFIPDFGRKEIGHEISEGVCDVVPEYHQQTKTILAMGHNVYYKGGILFDSVGDWCDENKVTKLKRFPMYNVREQNGQWLKERKKLECPELAHCSMYSCGSGQRVTFPNGNILVPIAFVEFGSKKREVTSLIYSFDGQYLRFEKKGSDLKLPVNRGLDEPSVCFFDEKFYMTIRAEDNHAYFSTSDDGLNWGSLVRWKWENGDALIAFSTQQHWLQHNGKIYLVYNRKTEENINVIRWRSPLFIAEFDPKKGCLIKDTEKTVFPMVGDGINDPDHVPMMGNFHPCKISDKKAIVTVGEMLPRAGWKGDTLIAYIRS